MKNDEELNDLANRAQAGDQEAWNEVWRSLWQPMRDYIANVFRDPHFANDVIQETYFRARKELPNFDGARGQFKGWLRQRVMWMAREIKRKMARKEARNALFREDCREHNSYTEDATLQIDIQAALKALRPEDSLTIWHRLALGETMPECRTSVRVSKPVIQKRAGRSLPILEKKLAVYAN